VIRAVLERCGRAVVAILIGCLFFCGRLDARERRAPRGNPTLVLASPEGERTVPVSDLVFVHFERLYYHRRAPRSEAASGNRMEIEDRRRECRCLRMQDWTKMKFKTIRQIELIYPPDQPIARLRVTRRDGRVSELGADALHGASESFGPRFAATLDGQLREFPLILAEGESWPDERLTRLLLLRPPQKAPPPARRSKERSGR
jgi:hypothetical protein